MPPSTGHSSPKYGSGALASYSKVPPAPAEFPIASTPDNVGKYLPKSNHKQQLSVTSNPVQEFGDLNANEDPTYSSEIHYLDESVPDAANFMIGSTDIDHGFGDAIPYDVSFGDFMTPEYSDNHISERTTPQELIWEQQFLQADHQQPHILDRFPPTSADQPGETEGHHRRASLSHLGDIYTMPRPSAQLLSPQLTTPSPPVASAMLRQNLRATPTPSARKRGLEPLEVNTSHLALSPEQTHSMLRGQSPRQQPSSPMVIVSSHPGDELLPDLASLRRPSTGKRGYERRSSHDAAEPFIALHEFDNGARLMPPEQHEAVDDDEEDTRTGQAPSGRGADQVSSINELANGRQKDRKNAEVEDWLDKSESGSQVDQSEENGARSRFRAERPRAHSTGIKVDAMGLPVYSDKGIPGPGVLIDVESEEEYTDDDTVSVLASSVSSEERPESPPVLQEQLAEDLPEKRYFPKYEEDNIPPEQQEPHPRQFYKRGPWQDPPQGKPLNGTKDQPNSSNAAASRFNQEAAKWETASRAATWGTGRRLSDSEVRSIVDGSQVRHMSLVGRGRKRGSTLLRKVSNLVPKRSNSNIKKSVESSTEAVSGPASPTRKESGSSIRPLQRIASFGKAKSPVLDGSHTLSPQVTATSHRDTASPETEVIKSEGLRSPLQLLRKVRSRSDVSRSGPGSSLGLAELMTRHGGPPVPTLASPMQDPQVFLSRSNTVNEAALDEDDDDAMDDVGVKMEFNIGAEHIIPTFEGFKIHARQLNPRLEPYLIDRIGQEQVRRYKKLLDNKVKHKRAVQVGKKCSSGSFCFSLGGDAITLPPRVNTKDPDATYAQFQVNNVPDGTIDDTEVEEGIVTPALFPSGIPLPPVKRLPAEFECGLCFKVKKFQKPSDWTKHVHEDVQPFSCTFAHCNEPKSFKRKADWVRHENERHRRLEHWKCNVPECSHICYRKDNFVQHLVREHKRREPKLKGRGAGSKAKGLSSNGWHNEDDEVWRLVDSCRFETPTKPRDEPCKFCGNVCSSWKKLSVHMGKHMEQLAMPVLDLVNMREVSPDTVISPIDKNYQQQTAAAFAVNSVYEQNGLSPYHTSAQSTYQNSSAGQSPAVMHVNPHMSMPGYDQGLYGTHGMPHMAQGSLMHGEMLAGPNGYIANSGYEDDRGSHASSFNGVNTIATPIYNSGQIMQAPISAATFSDNVLSRSQPTSNTFVAQDSTYPSYPQADSYGQIHAVQHPAEYTSAPEPFSARENYGEGPYTATQPYLFHGHQ